MSLYITSLNSGSNGNCYYIGNEHEAVLIDAGISCRETEKRLLRLGLSIRKIKAIFVSHEHSDHISGIPMIAKKHQIPVYITVPTMLRGGLILEEHLAIPFAAFQTITIGGLQITAFPKQHDASNPHSFVVKGGEVTIGVFTDIGVVCENLVHHFKQCHAAFLEANYDDEMLDKGNYPYHLKRKIRGGQGHLSNKQALELFTAHRPGFMTHLLLSHLSKNNNDPQLVHNMFSSNAGDAKVVVASRYEETEVFCIAAPNITEYSRTIRQAPNGYQAYQASLF